MQYHTSGTILYKWHNTIQVAQYPTSGTIPYKWHITQEMAQYYTTSTVAQYYTRYAIQYKWCNIIQVVQYHISGAIPSGNKWYNTLYSDFAREQNNTQMTKIVSHFPTRMVQYCTSDTF